MPRTTNGLHKLIGNTEEWTDDLSADVEDWLEKYCTRDQLIKITDITHHTELAPFDRPDPKKAVLALDIVEHIAPQDVLAALDQVLQQEAESEAAFRRWATREAGSAR